MSIPRLQTASHEASHEYWLPPGIHNCTIQDVEDALLYNHERRKVWERFVLFLQRVHDVGGTIGEVYVNGSFVTGRSEPGDVDGVAFIVEDDMSAWMKDSPEFGTLRSLLCESTPRYIIGADLFFVSTQRELDRWIQIFTQGMDDGLPPPDAQRDPVDLVIPAEKGILRVDVTDLYA